MKPDYILPVISYCVLKNSIYMFLKYGILNLK